MPPFSLLPSSSAEDYYCEFLGWFLVMMGRTEEGLLIMPSLRNTRSTFGGERCAVGMGLVFRPPSLRHSPGGHCFRDNALAACRKAQITPNAIFESDQFASIFALVAAGTGLSLIPAMAAASAEGCRVVPLHP